LRSLCGEPALSGAGKAETGSLAMNMRHFKR